MTVDPIKRTDKREVRPCPNCGSDVLEPRSSDKWHCAGCARQWEREELTDD